MKPLVLLLVLSSLMMPLSAKTPTANDVTVAVAAITDSAISAVAAFLNTPSLQLPGSKLHFRTNETLPYQLSFEHSDIGTYLPIFQKTRQAGTGFFASLLSTAKGPLNDVAIQYLTVHGWEAGHALLTGSMYASWGEGVTLTGLMTTVIATQRFPSVRVATDVTVDGRRVSTPVRVEGTFLLYSADDGYFTIDPLTLKINGQELDL